MGTASAGTRDMGSHLRQLRDLNEPLEVLQVAGAVEEVLQPARAGSGYGRLLPVPDTPSQTWVAPTPRLAPRGCHWAHAVLERVVVCATTKPMAGPRKTPSLAKTDCWSLSP